MLLDELKVPVVLAPMAGGPSTPPLAAAVSEAGGLGFLPAGYLSAAAAGEQIAELRTLTQRPFGINLFMPGAGPSDPGVYSAYVERLRGWAAARELPLGEPRYSDDDFEAKVQMLLADPVAAVSFTFGRPDPELAARLRAVGTEVWVTITSAAEAEAAAAIGIDVLVVQGAEAGGHRGSFEDREHLPAYGLLTLLQLVRAQQAMAVVAAGGIATGAAVAAVLCAGAAAAQIGSAFMLCPEAGTSAAHRAALQAGAETALTRAFSGRLARGIRNELMATHEAWAPIAYPEIHYATAPMRAAARERGDGEAINLWAGEAHQLARAIPAREVVRKLAREADAALARAGDRARVR